MACTTLESIVKGCFNNLGGIYSLLINDHDNVTSVTVDAAAWEVTAVTKSAVFEQIEFNRYVGNYVEDQQSNNENGSTVVTATITLMLHRREGAKSRALKIMAEGNRYLDIVLLDGNGKYWYFPNCQLQSVGEGSGQAKADGSKYNVVFVAINENLAYEVDPAIVAGLLTI